VRNSKMPWLKLSDVPARCIRISFVLGTFGNLLNGSISPSCLDCDSASLLFRVVGFDRGPVALTTCGRAVWGFFGVLAAARPPSDPSSGGHEALELESRLWCGRCARQKLEAATGRVHVVARCAVQKVLCEVVRAARPSCGVIITAIVCESSGE